MNVPSEPERAARSRPVGRAAIAAVVLWIAILSGLFFLLEAPASWMQAAARVAPGIWAARSVVHGIVYRGYAY